MLCITQLFTGCLLALPPIAYYKLWRQLFKFFLTIISLFYIFLSRTQFATIFYGKLIITTTVIYRPTVIQCRACTLHARRKIQPRFHYRRTNSYMYIHPILQRTTVIGDIRQIIRDNVSSDDNAVRLSCVDIGSHTKGIVHSKRLADVRLM